jgi:hypothetical protein
VNPSPNPYDDGQGLGTKKFVIKDQVISSFIHWVKESPYRHDVRVSTAGFCEWEVYPFQSKNGGSHYFSERNGISATKRMLEGVVH